MSDFDIHDLNPARTTSATLANGRRLTWHEWGDEEGTPVLFMTGAGMSGSLGFGSRAVKNLGLRLLSLDRPGLGQSSPHPAKSLLSWQDDVAELLRRMNIQLPLAVGFSQGAPFALSLASAGLISALALVSGQDDFNDDHALSLLPPQARSFVQSVQSKNPDFLTEFAKNADAEGFLQLILSLSSEKDRELYGSSPFKEAYRRCLNEGFSQDSQGYVQDLVLALDRWPFDIEKISVPVDLWYGALDGNPTHSPDFGATLAKRLPTATRHFLNEEGGSLLWTKASEILTRLIQHTKQN